MKINRWTKKANKDRIFIALCLLPCSVALVVYFAYPMLTVFFTAFAKWDYTTLVPQFSWDGALDNFKYIFFKYPYFSEILKNSLAWAAIGIFLQIPFTVCLALTLSKKLVGWKIARNTMVIPNIISGTAMSIMIIRLCDPQMGIANSLIRLFNPSFEGNVLLLEGYAFWCIVFSYFFFVGTTTLLLMGQIFAIPTEIYDAAKIDGASALRVDFTITVPLISGMIGTLTILAGTSGFVIYDNIRLMTEGGAGTMSLSYAIREIGIESASQNMGRANALGLLQFLILLLINGVVTIVFKPGTKRF